jgi:exodeoxyribonuclease VII small subunit
MNTEKSFEASLEELGLVLDQLEAGDLPLEQSLELYERGVRLWRVCQKQLNDAEGRIEHLLKDEAQPPRADEAAKSYEASLDELEEVVEQLESDDLPLERLVALAERGVQLWRACQGRLSQAERKVELLLKSSDGTLATVPFEEMDE